MQVTSREHVQTSAFPPEARGRVPLCHAMTRQGFLFSGWMPMALGNCRFLGPSMLKSFNRFFFSFGF